MAIKRGIWSSKPARVIRVALLMMVAGAIGSNTGVAKGDYVESRRGETWNIIETTSCRKELQESYSGTLNGVTLGCSGTPTNC